MDQIKKIYMHFKDFHNYILAREYENILNFSYVKFNVNFQILQICLTKS